MKKEYLHICKYIGTGNLFIHANISWVIHVKDTFAYMQMYANMKGWVINSYRGYVDLFMHI